MSFVLSELQQVTFVCDIGRKDESHRRKVANRLLGFAGETRN